jgi:cell division protein FtsZ
LLKLNHTLQEYPYSHPGYGKKVAVVAVGTAGSKVAAQLSKQSRLLEHYLYVTCDEADVANVTKGEFVLIDALVTGKSSPYALRGLAEERVNEIRQHLKESKLVFVISGLGGTVGSGIAPWIVREAIQMNIMTVAIVLMPFAFEKQKHFFAGSALKRIRAMAHGVILIDNDEFAKQPVVDANAEINEKIALALNKLLGSSEEREITVALNNVVNFLRSNSYSVLCVDDSGQEAKEYSKAVMNAASHFGKTVDTSEACKSIVHLCTGESISMNELVSSIGCLSSRLGNGTMSIEYGLSTGLTNTTTAVIMATGFSKTKFDNYDPIDAVLGKTGKNNLEGQDLDSSVNCQFILQNLEC